MSLDDLLARYSPERPLAERRALLVAMATRLPAPEFLWYDLAMQALHGEEVELREPALALLGHAPRSWHQVLMSALTDGSVPLQLSALKALYGHAERDAGRREAFLVLGDLPGWRVESLALWHALCGSLAEQAPVEAPEIEDPTVWPRRSDALASIADADPLGQLRITLDQTTLELDGAREEIEALEARVVDLEEENFGLREDRARLGEAYEAERKRADDLGISLEELQARHDKLHGDMLTKLDEARADAEQDARRYALTLGGLQGDLDRARTRHRRSMGAGMVALAVLAFVGGPIVYSLASHASAMAVSPEDLPVKKAVHVSLPHATAHATATPMAVPHAKLVIATKAPVTAAKPAGDHQAYDQAVKEARALEGVHHVDQAIAVWRLAARLAPTPADATAAKNAAHSLDALERAVSKPAARVVKAPLRAPQLPVAHAPLPPVVHAPAAHAPAAAHVDIPQAIRAKF